MHERAEGAARDVSASIRPGDVLAGRYRLDDLLDESRGARFWRGYDQVLARHVAVHVILGDDERAPGLMAAARASATVPDRRFLRVLDVDERGGLCFVVNEWGAGRSLDIMVAGDTTLEPRHAAWITAEVASAVAAAHDRGVSHGRLVPENVLLDHHGEVRVIGLAVDAALHGLPPGRRDADVLDLGGILYTGLTGRWAGVSRSEVPRAPVATGRVLRPRKVRAGIPGTLDDLCVGVLDPGGRGSHARAAYDLTTAAGIADYLHAFAGDPAALAAQLVPSSTHPGPGDPSDPFAGPRDDVRHDRWLPHPTLPSTEPSTDQEAAADPGTDPEDTGERPVDPGPPTAPTPAVELPTEAGMPIFDDELGEMHWLTARSQRPPPPPPFEQPAERPLFAPEPPPGVPARTPREGVASPSAAPAAVARATTGSGVYGTGSQEFWPWRGGTATTGSGSLLPVEDLEQPGRRWMRLAVLIAAGALLLLAIVIVSALGGDEPAALDPTPTTPGDDATTAAVVTGLTADDFDPQGSPPEENPDLVGAAVDGDPSTAWRTMTYEQNLGPGGLKSGVGLTVDLGQNVPVSSAQITFQGGPTTASVYLTDERPSSVRGLTPVVTDTVDGTLEVDFEAGATGRYVTVWLTSLPEDDGGFRGRVAEVVVRG